MDWIWPPPLRHHVTFVSYLTSLCLHFSICKMITSACVTGCPEGKWVPGNKAPRTVPAVMCEGIMNIAERTDSPLFQQCPQESVATPYPDFRDVRRTVRKHLHRDPVPTRHTTQSSYCSHWQVPIGGGERQHPTAYLVDTCPWMPCSHCKLQIQTEVTAFSEWTCFTSYLPIAGTV